VTVLDPDLAGPVHNRLAANHSYGLCSWRHQPALMPLPHRHSDIELNLLLAGEVTYVHRDRFVQLAPGHLAIFWAAIPHQLVERQPACDFCIITLPLELFLAWKLPAPFVQALLAGEMFVEPDEVNMAIDRLLLLRWHADLATGQELVALKELEARLWRLALQTRSAAVDRLPGEPVGKAWRMAEYIVANYSTPLAVHTIAAAVGLHPNYAMTCFRQAFGMTILEYVLQYRVTQAQRLLVTTDASVLDIALHSGFGSLSSFYTAFQRYTGRTPRSFRQVAGG
jgi:AraC-like DNA-binding protein